MLDKIFKEYDIRGLVGEQLTFDNITAAGAAFITAMGLQGETIIIGYDMRPSSPQFAEAFAEGAALAGVKTIQTVGLVSTDALYYASGAYNAAGVMFTASHNPAQYNGIKLCLKGALGLSRETGLENIKNLTQKYLTEGLPDSQHPQYKNHHTPILEEYANKMRKLVDLAEASEKHVVIDAGNGMAGLIAPIIFEGTKNLPSLPYKVTPMFFDLDGTFPNHSADPLNPDNLVMLQQKVTETGADIGLAFDGDADRCFIIDEKGQPVPPSTIAAIIVEEMLQNKPNSTVLYSQTTSKVFKETIEKNNGTPHMIKVGHSTAKQAMKQTGAIFGAEHSAHYYFKDFYGADSGMLAALYVLKKLATTGDTMSMIAGKYNPYYQSGEINSKVDNVENTISKLKATYGETFTWNEFDGIFFEKQLTKDTWVWFNVRASNTEPLLRLNVESNSKKVTQHMVQEILNIIRN